jgi:hypothetical protein
MNHDETYQTDKFGDLLMLVTGGTNHTMAEEHVLYRKALRAVVELHKPIIHKGYENQGLFCANCEFDYPCPTIQAIERELSV